MEELKNLADRSIESLKTMQHPIVRVCGPLTTGPHSYDENIKRFAKAEAVLTEKGYNVFYLDDTENEIQGKNYSWPDIQQYFHEPILRSGLIDMAFFLPDWQASTGATWEHNIIEKETNIKIEYIEESWLND